MWNSAGNNLKIGKEIIINTARRSKPLITLTQRGKAKVRRDIFVKFKGELPVRGFFFTTVNSRENYAKIPHHLADIEVEGQLKNEISDSQKQLSFDAFFFHHGPAT